MGRDCSGETLGETETETEARRGQQGDGQSESEDFGAEVSAIVGRQRRLKVDGEEVEAEEEASVSRDMGMGLKAGQMEELRVQEESQERTSGAGTKRRRWLVSGAGVKKRSQTKGTSSKRGLEVG